MLTFLFFVISCRKNGAVMTILGLLVICFSLLAGGVHSPRCKEAAGYVGWACASAALYAAFATLVKSELGYTWWGMNPISFL